MTDHKFIRCESDPCLYFKNIPNGKFVILVFYVDDMLFSSRSMKIVCELKTHLTNKFDIKYLGAVKKILGMTIL